MSIVRPVLLVVFVLALFLLCGCGKQVPVESRVSPSYRTANISTVAVMTFNSASLVNLTDSQWISINESMTSSARQVQRGVTVLDPIESFSRTRKICMSCQKTLSTVFITGETGDELRQIGSTLQADAILCGQLETSAEYNTTRLHFALIYTAYASPADQPRVLWDGVAKIKNDEVQPLTERQKQQLVIASINSVLKAMIVAKSKG